MVASFHGFLGYKATNNRDSNEYSYGQNCSDLSRGRKEEAPKGSNIPMEAKYWQLLINHFNNELQEVKDKIMSLLS